MKIKNIIWFILYSNKKLKIKNIIWFIQYNNNKRKFKLLFELSNIIIIKENLNYYLNYPIW